MIMLILRSISGSVHFLDANTAFYGSLAQTWRSPFLKVFVIDFSSSDLSEDPVVNHMATN
jgi:hypothetical protein